MRVLAFYCLLREVHTSLGLRCSHGVVSTHLISSCGLDHEWNNSWTYLRLVGLEALTWAAVALLELEATLRHCCFACDWMNKWFLIDWFDQLIHWASFWGHRHRQFAIFITIVVVSHHHHNHMVRLVEWIDLSLTQSTIHTCSCRHNELKERKEREKRKEDGLAGRVATPGPRQFKNSRSLYHTIVITLLLN